MPANPATRARLGSRVESLVIGFELAVYGIAFLLLVVAAVLVVVGSIDAVSESVAQRGNSVGSGVLILDRVLLVLIVAELAYTLRNVLQFREIAAEPFLVIGLIAAVRRVLIVTATFEQAPSDEELTRLLYELGALSLLVLVIAAAIFMLRRSAGQRSPQPTASSTKTSDNDSITIPP